MTTMNDAKKSFIRLQRDQHDKSYSEAAAMWKGLSEEQRQEQLKEQIELDKLSFEDCLAMLERCF